MLWVWFSLSRAQLNYYVIIDCAPLVLAGSSVEGEEEEVAVPLSLVVAVLLSLLVAVSSCTGLVCQHCKFHLYSRFSFFVLYNVCVCVCVSVN